MKRLFLFISLMIIASLLVVACGTTAPATEAPKEQAPAEEPKVEAPAEEPQEEAPAEEVKEEAPAEEAQAEMPAGEFNWRMYEGESIRVAMVTQPWSQFLDSGDYLAQFEELTGIDVTYEILPEDQFRQKTTIEFAAGTSDVDVFLSMVAQEGIKYESAGWYADFMELINNPAITNPDFDFADFTQSSLSIATLPNGKLIGLPVYNEFGALFYNKELFDQAGLSYPPKTLEEMEAAAAAIHDPDNGVYGVCLRGKGAAATSQFSSFMHSFGVDWVDADGNSAVLDPKFVEAVNWYGMMDREYGPPGATSYHWQQCQDIFLQGKVGMWADASVFFANIVDPEQSKVVDQAGIAIVPTGPAGQTPYVGGWHLSIYDGSQYKEAAWLFVQWALGKEMVKEAQLNNITTGRTSAWQSPEYVEANKYPELADTFLTAMSIGDPRWNPPVLAVSEARDAVGAAIVTAIEGGDVDSALQAADEVMQKLLADTPKLAPYAGAAMAAEPAVQPEAEEEMAAGEFNWRMYEGESIRVAMVTQPWSQFLDSGDYLAQFEELTGIDVTYEILPEDQFRQKTTIEFAAGTSDVDVFLSMVAQEGIKYESAGWYADFMELINNPDITNPDFDFADFTKSSLSIATLPNGKLIGLPVYNEFGALFFNKALFEAAGVSYPPQTLEEMEAAAAAIHDPDNGIYGVCLRGKGAAATSQFSSFMHSYGVDWVDADGNSSVLDPKFVEAVNWYGMMDREYGPPGATSYHWQQCQDIFLQGKVGMWKDASVFFANLIDPEQSKVVDQAGIAIVPAGPAGQTPYVGGWHLSIYNGSQHKEAAWLFIQWALGKEMTKQAQLKNITTGRTSAWQSPEYVEANKYPELTDTFLTAMSIGDPRWNPPVLAVSEARDAVGAAIVTAIEGGDVDSSLQAADEVMQKLLADTPKLQ